jgi:hypothetical protein
MAGGTASEARRTLTVQGGAHDGDLRRVFEPASPRQLFHPTSHHNAVRRAAAACIENYDGE